MHSLCVKVSTSMYQVPKSNIHIGCNGDGNQEVCSILYDPTIS